MLPAFQTRPSGKVERAGAQPRDLQLLYAVSYVGQRQLGDIHDQLPRVPSGSTEQTAGLSEMGCAMQLLDQQTQQNSTLVEQTNAATRALHAQATMLANRVARLRLVDDDTFSTRPMDGVGSGGSALPSRRPSLAIAAHEHFAAV